jgi:hypothetical protein
MARQYAHVEPGSQVWRHSVLHRAVTLPHAQGPSTFRHPILEMQRTIGNRAVQRLLSSGVLQTKLTIGTPDDIYEKEADVVSSRVMSNVATAHLHHGDHELGRPCGGECGGECAECATRLVEKSGNNADSEAPPIVHEVLGTAGQPLDDLARKDLERGFGADFGHVRIHSDSKAAKSARAVDALAYTVNNHIVFGEGQYSPGTSDGNRLLAHELTHTIQQGAAGPVALQQKQRCVPDTLQRLHTEAGRKVFDCPDFAGDKKLEACLNDEDRLSAPARGSTVEKIQNALLKDGADLGEDGADGVYGAATGKAVQAFKRKYRLGFEEFPDVGPGTMTKLDELCAKPGPTPVPPPAPSLATTCFDKIDWDAFFEEQTPICELNQASIDAACALAPNSPFNLGPDICPKTSLGQRVEDCVADAGFLELFNTCGIRSGAPGKSEIRQRFRDFKKRHP